MTPRALTLGLVLAASAFAFAGCRTNLLPEYMPKVQSASISAYVDGNPEVRIGSSDEKGATGVATGVATYAMIDGLVQRLAKTIAIDALTLELVGGFQTQLQDSSRLQLVDKSVEHDASIEISVNSFGFEASNIESPLYYFFNADVRMVYLPEAKLIWEYGTHISAPVNDVFIGGSGIGALIGTATNLAALQALTDDELRAVFTSLAQDAGRRIVRQLNEDAVE